VKLSIVIPLYNEEKTLGQLLNKVIDIKLPEGFEKEILLVNDSSKDSSQLIINDFVKKYSFIKSLINEKNLGKSQTVRNGILQSTGEYVVVQDADLEYEPSEIVELLELALKNDLDVVYGNRFGKKNKVIYWQNYFGNKLVSLVSDIFTFPRLRKSIPDMEVCYKLIKGDIARDIVKSIVSKSNFGIEPEITAKIARYKKDGKRLKLGIVPVSYYPRSIAEGKKMKAFRDGFKAVKEIIVFNLGK
jgi:glycosyltransferase involved in cell wall biosynthesis